MAGSKKETFFVSFCCYYLLVIVSDLLPRSDIKTLLKSTKVLLSLSKNTISIRSVMSSMRLLLILLNTVVQLAVTATASSFAMTSLDIRLTVVCQPYLLLDL
jgi:hypothetical protein